jgi:anti-sigma factor RsiW
MDTRDEAARLGVVEAEAVAVLQRLRRRVPWIVTAVLAAAAGMSAQPRPEGSHQEPGPWTVQVTGPHIVGRDPGAPHPIVTMDAGTLETLSAEVVGRDSGLTEARGNTVAGFHGLLGRRDHAGFKMNF